MRLCEQLEKGRVRFMFKRRAGNWLEYKRPRAKFWRKWMKNRRNDEDMPMYNRYHGYEF